MFKKKRFEIKIVALTIKKPGTLVCPGFNGV